MARALARRGRPSGAPDPDDRPARAQRRALHPRLFRVPDLHPGAAHADDRHHHAHPRRPGVRHGQPHAAPADHRAVLQERRLPGLRRRQAPRLPAARPDRLRRRAARRGGPAASRHGRRPRPLPRRPRLRRPAVHARHEQQQLHVPHLALARGLSRHELGHARRWRARSSGATRPARPSGACPTRHPHPPLVPLETYLVLLPPARDRPAVRGRLVRGRGRRCRCRCA